MKGIIFLIIVFSFFSQQSKSHCSKPSNHENNSNISNHSNNLEDLITSLFGGDGIQLVASSQGFSHAPHFQDDALRELNALTQGAQGSRLPVQSTSAGIIYKFDATLDDFIPMKDSFDPVYVERANTLGSGNFMLGFNYANANWSSYNGHDLGNIKLVLDMSIWLAPVAIFVLEGRQDSVIYLKKIRLI